MPQSNAALANCSVSSLDQSNAASVSNASPLKAVGAVERTIFGKALCESPFDEIYPALATTRSANFRFVCKENGDIHVLDEALDDPVLLVGPSKTLLDHTSAVYSVCVSGDGRYVVSGSADHSIKVWEISRERLVHTLTGHSNGVQSVCVSGDGRYLVSGSLDLSIKVWEMSTGRLVHTLGHVAGVSSVCVSGDGRYLVSGSHDNSIKVWEMSTKRLVLTLTAHSNVVSSVCVSGDGQYLVSGSRDRSIKVWEMSTGRLVHTLTDHLDVVSSVCVSGDGRYLVSGSHDLSIKVWEMSTKRLLHTLTGHSDVVSSVCVSGDGQFLVSGSYDHSVKMWELSTGRLMHTLTGHTNVVFSVCVSGDGRYVASGSRDRSIKVWEMSTARGGLVRTLAGNAAGLFSVCVSGDGRYLVSGSADHSIKVWEISTGGLVHTLTGHTNVVFSVCVSDDGRYVVSGSRDRSIKVWEMSTGRLVQSLQTELPGTKQVWLGSEDIILMVLREQLEVWKSSVLKAVHTTLFDSFHVGRDGNVYGYAESTKCVGLLYSDTLNAKSTESALTTGQPSVGKFLSFVAAALMDRPKLLDKWIRRWGNAGIDAPQPDTGISALGYALILGHSEVVRVLLLHGANPLQQWQLSDGSMLDAMGLGYSHQAAMESGWLPASSLSDYQIALEHNAPPVLFSALINNSSFADALIRSTLRYIEHGALDLPTAARKLNDIRRLRSSQETVQLASLLPVGVDLQQLCSILESHRSMEQRDKRVDSTHKDIAITFPQVMADISSHRTNASWTLDEPSVLHNDLSSVASMLERLDAKAVSTQIEHATEEIDHLELLLCGLPTCSVRNGNLGEEEDVTISRSINISKSVSAYVEEALHALSQWQVDVQGTDATVAEHTEDAAAMVQSRLRAVMGCFGKNASLMDDSNVDVQSALEELQEALFKEKEYHDNHQNVLKAAFPAQPLSVALHGVRDLKRVRVKELQELLDWNDRLLELQEKLEHAVRLYSRLDYKHLYEVHHEIEDLRLDIEELRVNQRRRQRTMTSEEGQEQQQAISRKKLRVKRLVRELDVQKSILVSLAEVGFADAMAVATKLGGTEWSALKLEDFEDLERLATTPGQRRMLFKATLDGETVVLKEYGLHSPESWQQLQNELKLLGRVENPHVMPLRAAFVSEDNFKAYAVFPFFGNGSLDVWIDALRRSNASGSVSNTQWEAIWRQVLSGLQALHDRRIVHCDIKPSNIFVDANPHRVVVGDFDISQDTSQRTQTLATLSKVAGTLGFIAPELLSTPPRPATPMVDIFAFGVTVATVMTSSELESAGALAALVRQCQDSNPQQRPTAAEALGCSFFTQQVVQEKEELEREAKHIAALQAEVYATAADVEEKKGRLLRDQQALQSLMAQLEQDKQHAKKAAKELYQEQTRVETLQRQVLSEKESVQKQTKKVARLQKDIEQERAQLQKIGRIPRIPPYWSTSKYDLSLFQKVDVTADLKKDMQSLFNKCCNSATLGHGRDQQQAGSYSQLNVHTVWRVENFKLWNKYVARKMELKSLAKGVKGGTGSASDVVTTDQHSWVRDTQLNGRMNEKLLFHGTDSVVAEIICEHGFDERVAALGGMFGAGIYFAEQCSKSDQYVRRDSQGLFYMFVSRVMLGTQVYHTQASMSQIRRPPDVPCQRGRCFDSVVFDATGQHYREFIVYDRTQAYPEFLVAYQRQ